ncbi:MAG TPA: sigma-70 family RNA polymerase sigma factor, partial [Armatimonadota bacterium]|nr:sigma-70 family RNA polymerase sigma factor [Armatimonadota bacterium]
AAPPPLTLAEAEALLGKYRGGIYGFIRRKGFSAEEADDLTQETLIRAYLHLSGFRGASLDAWLYRIAANVSVDYLRKRRVATVPLDGMPVVEASTGEDPVARLDHEERRARVLAVIGELPECHQRILRLRYYEDCSLVEIARVMNCTPLAAKLRVFRAVTALRKRWRSLALDAELLRSE